MKHNLSADIVKPRLFLKIVLSKFSTKQFAYLLHTNCKRDKVQHLHVQIVCLSYFYNPAYWINVIPRIPSH